TREKAAIKPDTLARDVAGMDRAQEGAGAAELLRRAEAAGGDFGCLLPGAFLDRNPGLFGADTDVVAQPVRLELARQKIVDRDIAGGHLPRHTGEERGEPRPRPG